LTTCIGIVAVCAKFNDQLPARLDFALPYNVEISRDLNVCGCFAPAISIQDAKILEAHHPCKQFHHLLLPTFLVSSYYFDAVPSSVDIQVQIQGV
jgi:hypothetical protein